MKIITNEHRNVRTASSILPFALFGFLAPISTYMLAVAAIPISVKISVLSLLAAVYALLFFVSYRRSRVSTDAVSAGRVPIGIRTAEDCLAFLIEELRTEFEVHSAVIARNDRSGLPDCLAGFPVRHENSQFELGKLSQHALLTGETEFDLSVPHQSSVSIPFCRDGVAIGLAELQLACEIDATSLREKIKLIEQRVKPMMLAAFVVEGGFSPAFADPVTGLPNEQAFNLVLDHELAESSRNPDDRPLSVLAVDIRDYNGILEKNGYVIGDRILNHAAKLIKSRLRAMDFLARIQDDEFFIVLPAANHSGAAEIARRIETAFADEQFDSADGKYISVQPLFGWATFQEDGETTESLVHIACARRLEAKAQDPIDTPEPSAEYLN